MANEDQFEGLVLTGVESLDQELGRGAYGRVYKVKYCERTCAAKEIHSVLVEGVGQAEMQRTIDAFLRECHQCSKLRNPNIIQFLGVYYPEGGAGRIRLPVMVMEMMNCSLSSFVRDQENIPIHIKFSIVSDVALGLCYLHSHNPPIVHRDLSPNNILLTDHYVAKVSDLGVAKAIQADCRITATMVPGTVDFMPPEVFGRNPKYGAPMDVFSFAGIVLHTFGQQWPTPSEQVQFDPATRRRVALSEVDRRKEFLDKMTGEVERLRPLVEECLDDDPKIRPTMVVACERIQANKDAFMKESSKDVIFLHRQLLQLKDENDQLRHELSLKAEQPAAIQQAAIQPAAIRPGDIRPGAMQPGAIHPAAMRPGSIHPAAMRPGSIHPAAMRPGSIHPAAIRPGDIHPAAMQPGAIHPAAMQPGAIHPAAMQPGAIHPAAMRPGAIHPAAMQPGAMHLAAMQPGAIHPIAIRPRAMHPAAMQPVATHPAAICPAAMQPVVMQPMAMQPPTIANQPKANQCEEDSEYEVETILDERETLPVETTEERCTKWKIESPPLILALTSGRYQIEWTQLADLPIPLYSACTCVTVQGQKIYVAGYNTPFTNELQHVYMYDVTTDCWDQLPSPFQYYGVPHIIGGKLCIIGGCLCTTNERTNQVVTFDEPTHSWMQYYPNLCLARSGPGVVTHLEHVIVAGGASGYDDYTVLDDIEVLNWIENSHWVKASVRLPVPMFNLKMTIFTDSIFIVGYGNASRMWEKGVFKIPIDSVTISNDKDAQWSQVTESFQWNTSPLPNSSPPLIIGGHDGRHTTADIRIYDATSTTWKPIDSLTNSRGSVVVAMVSDNAIVVMGGHRDAYDFDLSSVSWVEMGQAVLLYTDEICT